MQRKTIIVGAGVLLSLFFVHQSFGEEIYGFTYGDTADKKESGDLLFVGDIMLGRYVERLMSEHGTTYPFLMTAHLLTQSDVTIGNFEGTIPEKHIPTPNGGTTFSFQKDVMPTLRSAGFDVLSLANNHAFDYGNNGFNYTQEMCEQNELLCRGFPHELNEDSTLRLPVGDFQVGIVFIHAVSSLPDNGEIQKVLEELSDTTDVQIAYIHWGEEYESTHSRVQEALAHSLIENGIDAIIGHHPHVIQDIEMYQNKPIFYSLGNFIFDQYFSDDVQNGLMVDVVISDKNVEYHLIPISSKMHRSQPMILTKTERNVLLEQLLLNIEDKNVSVSENIISVPRNE